jgi:hypothetical protein
MSVTPEQAAPLPVGQVEAVRVQGSVEDQLHFPPQVSESARFHCVATADGCQPAVGACHNYPPHANGQHNSLAFITLQTKKTARSKFVCGRLTSGAVKND